MRPRSILATAIGLSLVALAGQSQAQSVQFQGSVQSTCWEDTAGFDASLQPNPLPVSPPPGSTNFLRRSHSADFTVYTLDAALNISSTGNHSHIRSGGTSFVESTSTCSGSFVINTLPGRDPNLIDNLDLVTSSSCTFQDTVPSGASGTVTGIHTILQLTQGIDLLMVSAQHPPSIETVNVTNNPGGQPYSYQRLCERAGSLSRLNP